MSQIKGLAFVELHIAGAFAIKRIRILKKPDRAPFVVFPAERRAETGSTWFDIAHPLTSESRAECLRLIMAEYKKVSHITVRREP